MLSSQGMQGTVRISRILVTSCYNLRRLTHSACNDTLSLNDMVLHYWRSAFFIDDERTFLRYICESQESLWKLLTNHACQGCIARSLKCRRRSLLAIYIGRWRPVQAGACCGHGTGGWSGGTLPEHFYNDCVFLHCKCYVHGYLLWPECRLYPVCCLYSKLILLDHNYKLWLIEWREFFVCAGIERNLKFWITTWSQSPVSLIGKCFCQSIVHSILFKFLQSYKFYTAVLQSLIRHHACHACETRQHV